MSDLLVEAVKRHKMIAILRRVEPSCLEQTARALESGGIRMLEVAFDQVGTKKLMLRAAGPHMEKL